MNTLKLKSIFATLLCCLFIVAVNAQLSDDLYYTPSTVDFTIEDNTVEETFAANDAVSDDTQFYTNDYSDYNQAYEDDYYYQSRLRRFCNPSYSGLSYYAPVYTNPYYYNNSPYSWSNNIYYQPVYGQNWWVNNRSNNYNYISNFAPYTSFGSTVFNSPYSIGSRGYIYNTGGFSQFNPYNNPCVVNNYVTNSIDDYNSGRTSNRSSVTSRTDRERPTSYRPKDNDVDRNKRTSGVRTQSSTNKSNDGYSNSTPKNTRSNSVKPRTSSNENATKTKKENRTSKFFDSFKNRNNSSKDSYKDNNSRNNSGKSYRSGSSNTRSYGSSSRSGSRSSGSRSSRSGGRR